jgi:hypothetical protein
VGPTQTVRATAGITAATAAIGLAATATPDHDQQSEQATDEHPIR